VGDAARGSDPGGVVRKERDIEVLWCSNQRRGRGTGWTFPPAVERKLKELTAGKRVCHLFGGRSRWGVRCDIDSIVKPDVYADAFLPPFVEDAFDVVILDPPYYGINQQMKQQLLRGAAYIAREQVIWFHTQWIAADSGMSMDKAFLVRVGDSCAVRCIQVFSVRPHAPGTKRKPLNYFTRGPAIKYNRWIAQPERLPLGELPDPAQVAS
jgi:hypothetical protein